jgi:hypothetical protein
MCPKIPASEVWMMRRGLFGCGYIHRELPRISKYYNSLMFGSLAMNQDKHIHRIQS